MRQNSLCTCKGALEYDWLNLKANAECLCNEQPNPQQLNPVGGKPCSSTKDDLLRYTYSIHKVMSLKFAYLFIAHRYISSPSEKTRPESWPGVRQLRSCSCHHPTASTTCNEQPSTQQLNPDGGKAYPSTKDGLLRYTLYTEKKL